MWCEATKTCPKNNRNNVDLCSKKRLVHIQTLTQLEIRPQEQQLRGNIHLRTTQSTAAVQQNQGRLPKGPNQRCQHWEHQRERERCNSIVERWVWTQSIAKVSVQNRSSCTDILSSLGEGTRLRPIRLRPKSKVPTIEFMFSVWANPNWANVSVCCVLYGFQVVSAGFRVWVLVICGTGTALTFAGLTKITFCFPFTRPNVRSILSSLEVVSLNFGGVFCSLGPSKTHFWAIV